MIDRDRLVTTFCDLVRIDSPSDEEEAMAQELSRRLEALGFRAERDAHGNLIASEEGQEPLLLSAHMDTVEPGRGIKPQVDGDTIRSDGTTILGGDCKAGVAAILEALESVRAEGVRRRPVQLAFTRGEELGLDGAKKMDYSMIMAREAVVFDGNGPVTRISSASPTYVRFDVKVTGRAAHAGVEPEKGLSAIRIAAEIISQLPQGRIDQETTFNIGTIAGGSVRNAVPESATFSGEFRSRNLETLDLLQMQVKTTLEEVRSTYQDATIEDDFGIEFHMYRLSPEEEVLGMVTRTLQAMGLEPELTPSGGGTDANVMRQQGISSVVVGMSTNQMHTVREYVVIPDLVDTARFCRMLLVESA
ncbi:MAG: M20/M25/M40 family metallo-hydrolase [Dehalococcoidia bacterium]